MRKAILILSIVLAFSVLCGYAVTGDDGSYTAAAYEETPAPAPMVEPVIETPAPVQTAEATPMRAMIREIPAVEIEEEAEEKIVPDLATAYDIELIARTIWGEAEIVKSRAEQAAVAWCVLNRVDLYGKPIEEIVLAPYQFAPRLRGDVPAYFIELAEDVVDRWEREHAGYEDVGRTLPADYTFFVGDGWRNHFSIVWKSTDYWDWSLPDPYTQEQ